MRFIKAFFVAAGILLFFVWQGKILMERQEKTSQNEMEAPVEHKTTGLQKPWAEMVVPKDNPITPEKVELGRLLFFDPIVSGDNKISCAHCHHPQKGLSDGGMNPKHTRRNPPTLYNAAFKKFLFVDGRAKSLEEQAAGPITSKNEMNEKPERLVKELKKFTGYQGWFNLAFKNEKDPITFKNVLKALASFERTLISNNSAFDKYAAGDGSALNEKQQAGLALFRSLKTQCFECHRIPTFDEPLFQVVGAPEKDSATGKKLTQDFGREEVTKNPSERRAFLVPTLRNVALTAPYMHNGALKSLREVIKFYANGGGFALGFSNVNGRHIRTFTMTQDETGTLISFLQSLTDISAEPAIPSEVPSGLHTVKHVRYSH